MLINRAKEEDDEKINEKIVLKDNLEEYQTANELFNIMAKNNPHNLEVLKNESPTAHDLVILYENIDLATKLLPNSIELTNKAPNQYVETIIYNDDVESEDSDVYELYNNEDLDNIFTINHERIELLGNMPSFENSLCHKFGKMHMKSSDFSNNYEKHFLFNDPYIKEQLQSIHAMTDSKQSDSAVLPMSLLDYICCKRLEDNYNFYMDNIINYVQHTIEQLKRISNGDYLTERVKEKWKEVESVFNNEADERSLLSTENSPLPIVGKRSEENNTWDEIVHSEMDVRCLTKILQKKIIVEIPKLLCGSYGLFKERFNDNLTISCKRSKERVTHMIKNKSSHVLVNLHVSETGQMNRNIKSVIVLKTLTPSIGNESCENDFVALHLKEIEYNTEDKLKIVELDDNENVAQEKVIPNNMTNIDKEKEHEVSLFNGNMYDTDSSVALIPSDELGHAMHRLSIQASVLEENEIYSAKKKKSPTRVRIKSPYENRSYVLDERKRKRLLEIREKREKKKLAMNESCKITKHKYVKGAIMAQSSNSVTKLSITNKSFYNSIYGQNNIDNRSIKNFIEKQDNILNTNIEEFEKELPTISPGKNGQKYINRSYYLDDADTEVMYLDMKPKNNEDDANEILTPSTSVLSSDVGAKISGFKNLINPSITDLSGTDTTSSLQQSIFLDHSTEVTNKQNNCQTLPQQEDLVPSNTPKQEDNSRTDKYKKITMSVECRRSIDKIYDLMKKITVSPTTFEKKNNEIEITNIIQGSDSGNNVKLQLTPSNPSSFGFEKQNSAVEASRKFVTKKIETSTTVVPKVIISSKFPAKKINEVEHKTRRENKKFGLKIDDNPLKAISQLLHKIDSVQKTKHKNGTEVKSTKKYNNVIGEDKNSQQFAVKFASREEKNIKRIGQGNSRFLKPLSPTKDLKFTQFNTRGEKTIHKKKLADIIDEVKEMRGEAVRGPSKRSSRIDNLAQPKKPYAKVNHDDYQNKYSRNTIPKVQKLTKASLSIQEQNTRTINSKNRQREGTVEEPALTKQQKKIGSSLEKSVKIRRPLNKSPVKNEKRLPMTASIIPDNCYDVKNTPDSLEKKMVAVESYLNNHFGRVSSTHNLGDKNVVHKSRVPLIPTDIDIASLTSSPLEEESTTLGNKLHKMVNSKIIPNELTLISLSEYKESLNRGDKNEKESVEYLSKCSATFSTSDHPVDIFKDKYIVTAVECVSKGDNNYKINKDQSTGHNVNLGRSEVQKFNSCNELQKLENALYHQMSNDTFQKRLRLKNFTLTPKPSIQQVFVLQSGDTGSLIVKSTLSQKLNFPTTDTIPKLNILPIMSHGSINSMQIATVGYVFPTYEIFKNNSKKIMEKKDIETNLHIIRSKNNGWVDKNVQCCNGNSGQQSFKQIFDTKDIDLFNTATLSPKETSDALTKNIVRQEILPKSTHENEFEEVEVKNSNNINNSTSLDILVGLLNEIKKITTCQSNLVTTVNERDNYVESKEIKIILNKADTQKKSIDQSVKDSISISSLDNQYNIYSSNFSLHLRSNVDDYEENLKFANDNKTNNNKHYIRSLYVDKEVNVQTSLKDFVHRFTDIPSRFFPSTVNNNTNVVRSLIAIVKKTSNKSVSSFSNCQVLYSNSTFNEMTALPNLHKSQSITSLISEVKILRENVDKENKTINICNGSYEKVTSKSILPIPGINIHEKKLDTFREFNPLIKMKRDVLVTLYSILVLTVFAALSIPEIISYA